MSLPQREGRPSLDISPESTPKHADWTERFDVSGNENNHPVKERKGPPAHDGWEKEAYDVVHEKEL